MSKLPQLKRLVVDDFQDQKSWISKLFLVVNPFMESMVGCLNQAITVRENMAADILSVTFSSVPTPSAPLIVGWKQRSIPISIHVGKCVRLDGASFTATAAIGIQWAWTEKGLAITNLLGVVPNQSNKYILTLVCFTG